MQSALRQGKPVFHRGSEPAAADVFSLLLVHMPTKNVRLLLLLLLLFFFITAHQPLQCVSFLLVLPPLLFFLRLDVPRLVLVPSVSQPLRSRLLHSLGVARLVTSRPRRRRVITRSATRPAPGPTRPPPRTLRRARPPRPRRRMGMRRRCQRTRPTRRRRAHARSASPYYDLVQNLSGLAPAAPVPPAPEPVPPAHTTAPHRSRRASLTSSEAP